MRGVTNCVANSHQVYIYIIDSVHCVFAAFPSLCTCTCTGLVTKHCKECLMFTKFECS